MTAPTSPSEQRRGPRRDADRRLLGARQELEAARRVTESLFRFQSSGEVIAHSLEIAIEVVGAEGGSILLADEASRQLVFRHSIGVSPVQAGTAIPWDTGIAGTVFRSGKPAIVQDAQADARHFKGIDAMTRLVTRGLIAAPLKRWHGGVSGVIEVVNKRGGPFDEEDLSLVEIVSAIAALAIERVRASEEARLAEVARVTAGIGHDIKNLLTPVVYGAEIVADALETLHRMAPGSRREAAGAAQARGRRMLEAIEASASRAQAHLKEIADCVQGLSRPLQLGPCRVETVVGQVFETLQAVAQRRHVALVARGLDRLPGICADEGRLFSLFFNLVNNAIAEVPEAGSVTVSGERAASGEGVELAVADTGPGIPPEVREGLFSGLSSSRKHLGSGLGLKLVKDAVDAHRGRISVESGAGAGTTFRIFLPGGAEAGGG